MSVVATDGPGFTLPRIKGLRRRAGRCYELAGRSAVDHEEWALVHGVVSMTGGVRMGHAWVERDGWVYDHVLDRVMRLEEFKAPPFLAVEWRRWPGGKSVAAAMLDHGHWGPWVDTDATN